MEKDKMLTEKTTDTKRIFEGRVVNLRVDDVILPNGHDAKREVVEHHGGVCILPITEDKQVYMVRQFRYAFNKIILEAPAGKLEKDEIPVDAANRELEEEIGVKAAELTYLGKIYPSVAYLTEVIHLYAATGLTETKQHLDEDEFLDIELYPFDVLCDMIYKNEICDAKTIAAVFKAKEMFSL